MSLLPAGQPLSHFLPNLDELLHDPAGYLGAGPVAFGPRRMYRPAALFLIAGAAILLSCAWDGKVAMDRVALGTGLILGGMVWLGWSLMLRGHEIVLHPDGVAVRFRDTTVWCPWALFNVDGRPHVPDADSPHVGLTLPVAPEAVPFVELRRDDMPMAHGFAIRSRQLRFTAAGEAALPARYEVTAGELGELLLRLGRRLGRTLPKGAPPPEAYRPPDVEELPAAPGPGGWVTVPLTRLRFPPRCAECCERTSSTMRFRVEPRWDWVLGLLTQISRPLELMVPVCPACQARIHERQGTGGRRGMNLGALFLLVTGFLIAWGEGVRDANGLMLLAVLSLAVGGLAGFLLGTSLSRRLPVQFRGYWPAAGKLSLRCRNPDYAPLVLDAMREAEEERTRMNAGPADSRG